MNDTHETPPLGERLSQSIPLPGLLALLVGGGVLIAIWRFPHLTEQIDRQRVQIVLGGAAFIGLVGLVLVASGLWRGFRNKQRAHTLRRRVVMHQQGMIYLLIMSVLLIGSLIGKSNMLMLVFVLLIGPFVFNGWVNYVMSRRVRIARQLPARAIAGEPLSVEITLKNGKWLFASSLMRVTDHIRNQRESFDAEVMFLRVLPRNQRSGVYQLRPMQRGIYKFGPLQVSSLYPLGLVERGSNFPAAAEMLVLPRLGQLTPRWKHLTDAAAELSEVSAEKQGTFDDEFHSLREYRFGDNPRAIHWQTSARQNELMIREYRQIRDSHLAVFLDLYLPTKPTAEDRERIELAVSFAATLCVQQSQSIHGAQLLLDVAGETRETVRGDASRSTVEMMLEKLAVAEGTAEPAAEELLDGIRQVNQTNWRSILVTTRRLGSGGSSDSKVLEKVERAHIVETSPESLEEFFVLE